MAEGLLRSTVNTFFRGSSPLGAYVLKKNTNFLNLQHLSLFSLKRTLALLPFHPPISLASLLPLRAHGRRGTDGRNKGRVRR